jgi:multidrug resistance efflux pump
VNRVQQLRLADQLGGRGSRGSNRGSLLPWVLCALMAVTWAGVGVRWYKNAPAPGASAGGRPAAGGAPGAPTPGGARPSGGGAGGAAPAAEGELLLPITGKLTPALQINLSPEDVSGMITEIYFKEGDRVKKGQELAKIRIDRYKNDRDAAKAAWEAAQARLEEMLPQSVRKIEVEQAHAEWEEAEAARVRARQELDRITGQKGTGVVSQQEQERAEADVRAAVARVTRLEKAKALLIEGPRKERVEAARADAENAKIRYEEAERLFKNCTIVAPIDGTILTKTADKGSLVSPMSFNVAAGICTMADLADLEAEIDVPEKQITRIKPGLDCTIAADADPTRIYRGSIDRVMPIADDSKNVIKVRVKVLLSANEEPGSFLKPKMTVVVNVYNRPFKK